MALASFSSTKTESDMAQSASGRAGFQTEHVGYDEAEHHPYLNGERIAASQELGEQEMTDKPDKIDTSRENIERSISTLRYQGGAVNNDIAAEMFILLNELDAAIARAELAEKERDAAAVDVKQILKQRDELQFLYDQAYAACGAHIARAEKAETELNELRKELLTYANRNDILEAQQAAWAKQLYLVNPFPLMRSIPDTESGLDVPPIPVLRPEKLVDLLDKLEKADAALEAARIEGCKWGLEHASGIADGRDDDICEEILQADPAQIVKEYGK